MKRSISFSLFFINLFLVTSVAGAQVRISNADKKQIDSVKVCQMSRGQNGEISNWQSDSNRSLKMQHKTADVTFDPACGNPKVVVDDKDRDLITIKIQNEGSRLGDLAKRTRVVFNWKKGKRPIFQEILIRIEFISGKTFNLKLKTGSDSETAIFMATEAGKKAEKAYGGVEYRGGRGLKLSLGGIWSFSTEGTDGYGTYLDFSAKVKKLSPKAYLSMGAMLSWHQYELYFIHSPAIRNPKVSAQEYDALAKVRLNFVLVDRVEIFAGLGLGIRSFAHDTGIGSQGADYYVSFTHAASSLEMILGAEVGFAFWLNSTFGLNVSYRFGVSLSKQIVNPSSFESIDPNKENAINHSLAFSLVARF